MRDGRDVLLHSASWSRESSIKSCQQLYSTSSVRAVRFSRGARGLTRTMMLSRWVTFINDRIHHAQKHMSAYAYNASQRDKTISVFHHQHEDARS
jgi:hypothetical protein